MSGWAADMLEFHLVGIAQLVSASDCGSEGRGFESHYPPFPILICRMLGYRQGVRHRTLTPTFAGSNPASPVWIFKDTINIVSFFYFYLIILFRTFSWAKHGTSVCQDLLREVITIHGSLDPSDAPCVRILPSGPLTPVIVIIRLSASRKSPIESWKY